MSVSPVSHLTALFYLCLLVFIVHLHGVLSNTSCDQCECTISNPEDGDRAVLSIKPRCEQGQVTWLNAHGAVRMELTSSSQGDVRYCIRLQSDNIDTVVSQEVSKTVPGNYKLKTLDSETVRLSTLFTIRGHGKEYCISGSGSVHLYLETERNGKDMGATRVKVHYDVGRTSGTLHYNPMEECRPCSDKELLRAYCSNDFVAIGTMDEVRHDGGDKSQIRVSVTQLVTQSEAVFRKSADGWTKPHELKGVIHVPRKCGIRHGDGQFLFTGRLRLGQPVLHCAPRYEQWKHVLEKAEADGLLECSYG